MAHPDHDQVIGRLVGTRLRGGAERHAVSDGAAEVHPDAETWAAYVDGGLRADEVARLETHLAGCQVCRRLLAVLAPEVSSEVAPAAREAETSIAGRGVVIPFPRRQVLAWMAAAAGLLMAVTLWSVSRLGGDRPVASIALSTPQEPAAAPAASAPPAPAEPVPQPNATAGRLRDAAPVDRMAAQAPAAGEVAAARQELDKRKSDVRSDEPALRRVEKVGPPVADGRAGAGAGAAAGTVGGPFAEGSKVAEEKQAAKALEPTAGGRESQLQTNTVAAGARPRGPLVNQQANQQASNQQRNATAASAVPPTSPAPLPATPAAAPAVAAAAPAPPAAAPVPPPAQADAAAAAPRERRANEQPPSTVSETVTITSRGGARRASAQAERGQTTDADREGRAPSKDEAAKPAAFGYVAPASALPSFAEPEGRLRWRIADGRRLESSSDGGTTWNERYRTRGDRLRAGTAPSIDSAWAVGERGLVLRLAVPGGWTPVARAGSLTLIAVTATGAQSARVTAADGSVFETADGGATWTPASPGAGPQ
jgi:hypothetical protein